jgi:formamidopyrimidine-DNA glycosylase
MPEGPEVKKMSTKVNNMISNLKLIDVKINSGRYLKKLPTNYDKFKSSLPLTVKNVNSHGKFMWWEFKDKNNEDSDITLFNTLGMTGYWTKENDLKHNNVSFIFEDNFIAHFNDYRNFGTIILCDKENLAKKLKTLGPDLLAIDKNLKKKEHQMLGVELFKKRLEKKRKDTMIASALLDQKVASGCGNYIRADILYLAKVDPFKEIGKLSNSEIEFLWYLMRQIAFNNWNKNLGLKYGVIDKKFKFAEDYNRHFFVYMQEKDINGKTVIREKLNSRTIHYVENP